MISIDRLEAVIRIDAGAGPGSAFALMVDGRQYLITAKHLLSEQAGTRWIRLWLFDAWHTVSGRVVGVGTDMTPVGDYAVFACSEQVSTFSLSATRGGFGISQDVYFLGYPYNEMTDGLWHPNLAFPLVKKAIVSGVVKAAVKPGLLILDGHNNRGFSGGPVLAATPGDGEFRAIGVVSGYRTELEPVDGAEGLAVSLNAGLIYAAPMKPVLDLIEANPTGHVIEEGWDWHASRFVSKGPA